MDIPNRLKQTAKRLNEGKRVYRITVRNFLGLFGAERRGAAKVEEIKGVLDELGLETEPNFHNAWIDEPIQLRLKGQLPTEPKATLPLEEIRYDGDEIEEIVLSDAPLVSAEPVDAAPVSDEPSALDPPIPGVGYDPTFRIGSLPAANKTPVVVGQDDTLTKAVTIMLQHDFSQLPVMQGEREAKGVISWKSISSRLALNASLADGCVRDYREDAKIVEANRTLFEVIPLIAEAGYVACTRFRRHRVRCFDGAGGASWRDGSLPVSSSLRLFG
jgi:CBS domain-containing protein